MRFLRYLSVCVVSAWVGLFLAMSLFEIVWPLFLTLSGITLFYLLLLLLIRRWKRRRSRMIPRQYYGPSRTQASIVHKPISLSAQVDRLVLDLTTEAVHQGMCQCCESKHFMLTSYPFDPQFHKPGCIVPPMRSLIVPISIYQQEVRRER